jgi:hypothetical protein
MYVGTNLVPTPILVTNVFSTNYADAVNGTITNYVPAFPTKAFWDAIDSGTESLYENRGNRFVYKSKDVDYDALPLYKQAKYWYDGGGILSSSNGAYSSLMITSLHDTVASDIYIASFAYTYPENPWGSSSNWWNYIDSGTNIWEFNSTNWIYVSTARCDRIANVYTQEVYQTLHRVQSGDIEQSVSYTLYSSNSYGDVSSQASDWLTYVLTSNMYAASTITNRPGLISEGLVIDVTAEDGTSLQPVYAYPILSYVTYSNINLAVSVSSAMLASTAIKKVTLYAYCDWGYLGDGISYIPDTRPTEVSMHDVITDSIELFGEWATHTTELPDYTVPTNMIYSGTSLHDPRFFKLHEWTTPINYPLDSFSITMGPRTFSDGSYYIDRMILTRAAYSIFGNQYFTRIELPFRFYLVIDWDWKYLPPQ